LHELGLFLSAEDVRLILRSFCANFRAAGRV
jgi:hypothetical protein